jgi:penicillin-binding protein 1B
MSIEVTSVPQPPTVRKVAQYIGSLLTPTLGKHLFVRTLCGLALISTILASDALVSSYKYYSRVIDARLATGYLTSRPGLYAAPRVLQSGQQLTEEQLVSILRRAGYAESDAGEIWNGTFQQRTDGLEIRPARPGSNQPAAVRVGFANGKIAELSSDNLPIDALTLEPEILSNDLSMKGTKREVLTYREIPAPVVHAILAIEDHRFFTHSGVDVAGLVRAAFKNVGDERLTQGGSTITQQLVKNTYLTSERTLRRKYAEVMLALALEQRLSKEEIFALYANEVYLGQRGAVVARGVKEAAHIFFGKELKDLTLAEAATIAGMIQGPARYSPLRHPDAAKERRNAVLAAMLREGWITAEQNASAADEAITVAAVKDLDNSLAPYFVDYVNRIAESDFDTSGNAERIYTTIDLELQRFAEQALQNQLTRLDTVYKNRNVKPQAALVALEPGTGNVLAMVGGRNYAESQLNRATDAKRQPGSTFKPFVYAAAWEDGMSPIQSFADAPREFVYDHNKKYRPANYGGGYSMGYVTMRTGLVKSLNVVTVDVALQTGLARISNLAARFGLPKPERYPAMALGTEEATPLEMASAYAAFVNDGRRVEPRVIASVGEPPGTHQQVQAGEQIISPTTAYMITNTLSAVIDHGTAKAARGAVKGNAVAGKTGTSRDGWFIGYTANLVCAVWIGFDDNQQLGLTGAEAALPAWVDFMNAAVAAHPNLGGRNFACPEGIKFVEIDVDTGLLSTLSCPKRELIAVTERLSPHTECYLHGNVPALSSPFAEQRELDEERKVAEVRATSRGNSRRYQDGRGNSFSLELKRYRTTRVDVDSQGRRSLVNELR